MSDKKISQFNELTIANNADLIPIVDVATNETKFIQKQNLGASLVSQTVTNGVTTKSPSEDAVFDAIYAKGLVKSNAWKNNGVGTFTLEADKYNIVNYSNTNIEILLPAVEVDKTIIVQGTTQNGSGAVNFTINNIKIGGADLGTPYSVTVTNEKEVLIFYGNYYGWHLIGHSNKTVDLSTKLDLDGGNANQDIDIDGFSVNAKHFKVNGTAGAGHIGLKHQSANISASASESSIGADSVGDPVWKNDGGAIDKLELQSKKDSTGGYAGLTLFKINFKNVLNTFTSFFTNSNTASRTYTFQNRDGIISDDTDLAIANNQVAYETWSTDANYTTQNTTAKRLIVLQTGTLTATKTLTLASVTGAGQEVIIVAGGSVTSTIKITVALTVGGSKINVTLNSFDIVTAYSQTLLTSVSSGSWTTGQASPQFVETATALTASKIVRAIQTGIGTTNSFTAPFANAVYGDIIYKSGVIMGAGDGGNGTTPTPFMPFDPRSGWQNYRPNGGTIRYWNNQIISSGNKPIIYNNQLGYVDYYNCTYMLEIRPESILNNGVYRCIFYVNSSGVPSILKVIKNSSSITCSVSGGALSVTGFNCYANIWQLGYSSPTELPELNLSYSNNAQTQYWTGSEGLGIGHTSQHASACFHADSTTKGFLPPRMTNTQRTNIVSPAIGLMVYCTDATEGLYIYKSTGWTFII